LQGIADVANAISARLACVLRGETVAAPA